MNLWGFLSTLSFLVIAFPWQRVSPIPGLAPGPSLPMGRKRAEKAPGCASQGALCRLGRLANLRSCPARCLPKYPRAEGWGQQEMAGAERVALGNWLPAAGGDFSPKTSVYFFSLVFFSFFSADAQLPSPVLDAQKLLSFRP